MKKLSPVLIVLIAAALALSACGAGPAPSGGAKPAPTEAPKQAGAKPTEQPAPKPTESAAQAPADTSAPNATAGVDLQNIASGLDSLNSYESTFTMSFEGKDDAGQPKTGSMTFTEDFVKDPPAKRTSIKGFGAMNGANPASKPEDSTMQTIEVGGKQYFQMGTVCSQTSSGEAPQASPTFNPADVIGGIHGAQLIGTETVNGVPTAHYKSDLKDISALGYLNSQGEFWIAQSGDFVVKYLFTATGKDLFMGNANSQGTIKWEYEVKQVNQPIDIQPPKDCASTAEDVPVMADAAEKSAFGGTSMYTSPSAFKDVVAFYEKEMKAKGWQPKDQGGMSADGVSMQSYTKDARTVQVMITGDANSGKTSVVITEEKQ